ncbi:MAG: iron-containing alcohol dehydrogenase [Methanosarcinaceae archaeon]|nr:iron-containing alcohol dehydrogenase [Methanosarcinaceae archaeon]
MSSKKPSGSSGPEGLIHELQNMSSQLGIRPGLSNMGVKEDDIDYLCNNAIQDLCLVTNPRTVTIEDIKRLYYEAL